MQTSQDIRTILKTRFGYDDFRPLQAEVIRAALGGQDCFALMPTGAGKSICYQLPALAMDGLTIVVSPLIALMKDQVDALKSNGVSAAFLNSAQSWDEQNAVRKSAFEKRLDLLYVAPERIPQAAFRHFLDAVDVSLIAVDEAHCISEWGHEFRPEYRNLKTLRALKPAAPVMALTATATERAREDIVRQLELREPRVFVASFDRPNLRYSVLPDRNRNEFLDKWLSDHPNESAIIYRGSRAGADETAERLADVGVSALPYHAGLDERTRTRNQERFVRDEARVIAATVAFGMGIDKPNVRLVMHYETPSSVERYYQESGRAGRDGLEADCVMFHGPRERDRAAYFIERMEDGALRAAAERNLDAITAYCQTASCRREALLAHFGERYAADGCGNCDNCLADTFDATIIAQKILSAVIRTGGRYGATYIAQVLRGSDSAQIRQRGHETLSVFGIVDDFSEAAIKELAASMSARGMLAVGSDYPTLSATAKGREFLLPARERLAARPDKIRAKGPRRVRVRRPGGGLRRRAVREAARAAFAPGVRARRPALRDIRRPPAARNVPQLPAKPLKPAGDKRSRTAQARRLRRGVSGNHIGLRARKRRHSGQDAERRFAVRRRPARDRTAPPLDAEIRQDAPPSRLGAACQRNRRAAEPARNHRRRPRRKPDSVRFIARPVAIPAGARASRPNHRRHRNGGRRAPQAHLPASKRGVRLRRNPLRPRILPRAKPRRRGRAVLRKPRKSKIPSPTSPSQNQARISTASPP